MCMRGRSKYVYEREELVCVWDGGVSMCMRGRS